MEWLIQHRSTGEEGEVIEEATAKSLEAMIGTVDKVVVLFCKYNFINIAAQWFKTISHMVK